MDAPSKIQVTFYLVRADAINVVLMPPSRATRGAAAAAPFQADVASEWLAEGDAGACDQEDLASEDLSFDHLSMISDSQSWVDESAGDSQASDGSSSRPSKAARILLECDRDAYTRRESIALKRKVVDQASTIAELKCELKRLKASPNGHNVRHVCLSVGVSVFPCLSVGVFQGFPPKYYSLRFPTSNRIQVSYFPLAQDFSGSVLAERASCLSCARVLNCSLVAG